MTSKRLLREEAPGVVTPTAAMEGDGAAAAPATPETTRRRKRSDDEQEDDDASKKQRTQYEYAIAGVLLQLAARPLPLPVPAAATGGPPASRSALLPLPHDFPSQGHAAAALAVRPPGARHAKKPKPGLERENAREQRRARASPKDDAVLVAEEEQVEKKLKKRRKPWTTEEETVLVAGFNAADAIGVDWAAIAAVLPGRTVETCRCVWRVSPAPPLLLPPLLPPHLTLPPLPRRRYHEVLKPLHHSRAAGAPWTKAEDDFIARERQRGNLSWSEISARLPGRTMGATQTRYGQTRRK